MMELRAIGQTGYRRFSTRALFRCHSAWGPTADPRGNSLNCLRKEGSNSETDSHSTEGVSGHGYYRTIRPQDRPT
jgi:hypothetical protein